MLAQQWEIRDEPRGFLLGITLNTSTPNWSTSSASAQNLPNSFCSELCMPLPKPPYLLFPHLCIRPSPLSLNDYTCSPLPFQEKPSRILYLTTKCWNTVSQQDRQHLCRTGISKFSGRDPSSV